MPKKLGYPQHQPYLIGSVLTLLHYSPSGLLKTHASRKRKHNVTKKIFFNNTYTTIHNNHKEIFIFITQKLIVYVQTTHSFKNPSKTTTIYPCTTTKTTIDNNRLILACGTESFRMRIVTLSRLRKQPLERSCDAHIPPPVLPTRWSEYPANKSILNTFKWTCMLVGEFRLFIKFQHLFFSALKYTSQLFYSVNNRLERLTCIRFVKLYPGKSFEILTT